MSVSWHLDWLPRKWQVAAHREWAVNQSGVVQVVTGGGKTVFAYLCMETFMRQHEGAQVVIVVPTTALLDQWYVGLVEDFNVRTSDIACFSGDEQRSEQRVVNIVVLNTARHLVKHLASSRDTMLIVDECHRAGSPVNSLALQGKFIATLGLSATPERDYDDGFDSRVVPVLGPIIYSYDYTDAAGDGVITPFDLVNIRVDLLPHEKSTYDDLSKRIARAYGRYKGADDGDKRVAMLLQRRSAVAASAMMRIPVSAKLVDEYTGARTLLFHERVEDANTIAGILTERGHTATVYHTGVAPVLRRDNLRLFRRGAFDVLVACRALDEGINVPEAQVAIIASSTASSRQRIQRLGRVLRPAPGKESAVICTLYATDAEEKRLAQEAEALEGVTRVVWKRGTRM